MSFIIVITICRFFKKIFSCMYFLTLSLTECMILKGMSYQVYHFTFSDWPLARNTTGINLLEREKENFICLFVCLFVFYRTQVRCPAQDMFWETVKKWRMRERKRERKLSFLQFPEYWFSLFQHKFDHSTFEWELDLFEGDNNSSDLKQRLSSQICSRKVDSLGLVQQLCD